MLIVKLITMTWLALWLVSLYTIGGPFKIGKALTLLLVTPYIWYKAIQQVVKGDGKVK